MRLLFAALLLLLPLSLSAAEKLKVVASFSILADITRQIAGDEVALRTLVGPDEDAHVYEPTPDDAKALLAADLVIANGLGFEPWLRPAAEPPARRAANASTRAGAWCR